MKARKKQLVSLVAACGVGAIALGYGFLPSFGEDDPSPLRMIRGDLHTHWRVCEEHSARVEPLQLPREFELHITNRNFADHAKGHPHRFSMPEGELWNGSVRGDESNDRVHLRSDRRSGAFEFVFDHRDSGSNTFSIWIDEFRPYIDLPFTPRGRASMSLYHRDTDTRVRYESVAF